MSKYKTEIKDSGFDPAKKILVATPSLGLVRMEWVQARYGQIIPTNWSMLQYVQFVNSFIPLRYTVADAQNVIVKHLIELKYEWLLFIEDDTCPPPDAFVRLNQYMRDKKVPVVSGLYYSRSNPPEPLIYRGRGTSYYNNWKKGDKVWADGVPTGFLLVHSSILQAMWDESPEYMAGDVKTRRVFETPERQWFDEEKGEYAMVGGTSDLEWCTRVMEGKYFEKAGWPEYQKKKYPFLVDTGIFCKHYDRDGTCYP